MLRHLHIRNLALIEDLELEFGAGLTVFTGETGAGKSLVLEALALLLGRRAAPAMVRTGAGRAEVEAVFDFERNGPFAAWLREAGLETDEPGGDGREANEPGEVILRREAQKTGRSRAWIQGRLVTAGQLAEAAARLLDLNSQNEQQTLLESAAFRDFYDEFCGLEKSRREVREAWEAWRGSEQKIQALLLENRDRAQRLDFIRFQLDELRAMRLAPGELAQLEDERRKLAHVEELAAKGALALTSLREPSEGQSAALELLGAASRLIEDMAARDASLRALAENVQEALARAGDASLELGHYLDALEANPARLAEIEDRIHSIRRILRKHGPSEEEAIARLQALQSEREALEGLDEAREEAETAAAEAKQRLLDAGRSLSSGRRAARASFLRPFQALLREFAIPHARIEISFQPLNAASAAGLDAKRGAASANSETPGPPGADSPASAEVQASSASSGEGWGPNGAELIELLFSANPGEPLQPMRKIASGGELSRILLALRSMNAGRHCGAALVFDEVDAGISGEAARRVAERLAALGERYQVLYVTHQPAAASVARRHYVIEKRVRKGRTETVAIEAVGEHRQIELARLLDGGKKSEPGLALAAELLQSAPTTN